MALWAGLQPKPLSQPLTGSSKSLMNGAQNVPSRRAQNATIINRVITVVLAAANTPQPVPGIFVPDGCTVRIRANNGGATGNAHTIFVASYPGAFAALHGTPLAPLDDIAWPSENLSAIWVYGSAGDGVVVSVISIGLGNS